LQKIIRDRRRACSLGRAGGHLQANVFRHLSSMPFATVAFSLVFREQDEIHDMDKFLAICLSAVIGSATALYAESTNGAFDGTWNTIVSCENGHGALGYSYAFPSLVKAGVLRGEHGRKNEPGWYQIDGTIGPDGAAMLYAEGLVGAAPYAVGHQAAGTQYGYHVDA
jgi:hypothetical protein